MTGRLTSYTREGLTFDVRDEGPLDGEVVVLLHGFPQRASSWRLVAPLLHAEGYRTLAPDQRGYSPGARPPRRRDYTMDRLGDDVAALIEASGAGSAHVVGHDWGSIAAWTAATRRPELVRSLTAVSVPHPQAFLAALTSSRQGLKSWYMAAFQLPRVPELLAAKRGGPFDVSLRRTGLSEEDVARFRTEIVEHGALPGGLAWYRAMPFAPRDLMRGPVKVPTTLVWSDGDAFVDRAGVERTAGHVDAPYELRVLPGVDHWVPEHAPEALAAAVLERVRSA